MGRVGDEGEGGGGAAAADGVVDGGPMRGGGEPGAVWGACEMVVRGVEWGGEGYLEPPKRSSLEGVVPMVLVVRDRMRALSRWRGHLIDCMSGKGGDYW